MNAWILAVTGVITLSVLVDILLPDGQTNKYIKGIFSVITLYVIISPLPKLISKNYDFSSSVDMNVVSFEIDENFLKGTASNPFKAREDALTRYLYKNDVTEVKVKYVAKCNNSTEVDYINIILPSSTLEEEAMNNLLADDIKNLVADFTGERKEDIRILYE